MTEPFEAFRWNRKLTPRYQRDRELRMPIRIVDDSPHRWVGWSIVDFSERDKCNQFFWDSKARALNTMSQMQGGQNWILPKDINANGFFWDSHWIKMWKNHHSPSMGLSEGSVASASEHIEHRGWYQSPQCRKPYGRTSLGFKPVCQDFPLSSIIVCFLSLSEKFIDLRLGDKVNSGIGLLYRPARLHEELTLSPQSESMNSATVVHDHRLSKRDLRFEEWKPVFVKRDTGVYMIDI